MEYGIQCVEDSDLGAVSGDFKALCWFFFLSNFVLWLLLRLQPNSSLSSQMWKVLFAFQQECCVSPKAVPHFIVAGTKPSTVYRIPQTSDMS